MVGLGLIEAGALASQPVLAEIDNVSLRPVDESMWEVVVRAGIRVPGEVGTIAVNAWNGDDALVSVIGSARAPSPTGKGSQVVVTLRVRSPKEGWNRVVLALTADERRLASMLRLDLRRHGSELTYSSPADVLEGLRISEGVRGTELAFSGSAIPNMQALEDLLSPDSSVPAWARSALAARVDAKREASELGVVEAALLPGDGEFVSGTPDRVEASVPPGPEGCNGGSAATTLALAVLSVLVLRRRLRFVPVIAVGVLLFGSPKNANATQRCVLGLAAHWDTRTIEAGDSTPYVENSYVGFRDQPCDSTDETCSAFDEGCCFKPLLGITARLVRRDITTWPPVTSVVDQHQTDAYGGIIYLCDPAWQTFHTYTVEFSFAHDASPPAQFEFRAWPSTTPIYTSHTIGTLTSDPHAFGMVSLNPPGDPTDPMTDITNNWATAFETFEAFAAQGETRIRRKFGSPNAYDKIVFNLFGSLATPVAQCDSRIDFDYGSHAVHHELGHILQFRLIGCSNQLLNLGAFDPHSVFHSTEAAVFSEAYAHLAVFLRAFDASTASTEDVVVAAWGGCVNVSHENDSVSENNLALGLWDVIDSDGGYTDSDSDAASFSFVELNDAMIDLANTTGTQGQNRTLDERYFVQQSSTCSVPCSPGVGCTFQPCPNLSHACGTNGVCYAGDPHGANARDILEYLPDVTSAWRAFRSGHCIGLADDAAPFAAGYRTQ